MEYVHSKVQCVFIIGVIVFLASWWIFIDFEINDTSEDAYSYLLSAQNSIIHGYGSFFGSQQHPLFTSTLYSFSVLVRNAFIGGKVLSLLLFSVTNIYLYKISRTVFSRYISILILFFGSVIAIDYVKWNLSVLSGPMFLSLLMPALFYLLREKYIIASLLVSILALIRAEYVLVLSSFLVILFILHQKKYAAMLFLINVPSIIYTIFSLYMSRSVTEEIIYRYGHRSLLDVLDQAIVRLSYSLFGAEPYNSMIVLFVMAFGVCLFVCYLFNYPHSLAKKHHVKTFLTLFFFVVSNFFSLVILSYLGKHPMAARHFGYLIPSVSFCFVFIVLFILKSILSLKRRHAVYFLLGLFFMMASFVYYPSPSYSANNIPLIKYWIKKCEKVYLWRFPLKPTSRFYVLKHWMDECEAVGLWVGKRVDKSDRFVSPLPSCRFFSGKSKESWQSNYPVQSLQRTAYTSRRIKYVVWSDNWNTQNRGGLKELQQLRNRKDFFFFRYVFSPVKGESWWHPSVYMIDTSIREDMLFPYVSKSEWYEKEHWGRWAQSYEPRLTVYALKAQQIYLSFRVGAFLKKADLNILVNGKEIKSYNVDILTPEQICPTKVKLQVSIKEGVNVIEFVGPINSFRPIDTGSSRDVRPLRMAYQEMLLQKESGRDILIF